MNLGDLTDDTAPVRAYVRPVVDDEVEEPAAGPTEEDGLISRFWKAPPAEGPAPGDPVDPVEGEAEPP